MERRNFFRKISLAGLAGFFPFDWVKAGANQGVGQIDSPVVSGQVDREIWVQLLHKIAAPVLSNMAKGQLVKNMPVEWSPQYDGRDKRVAYMEAIGRLMAGLAPWLALPKDNSAEGMLRRKLQDQALQSLARSVDPVDPDFLLWDKEGQPLVDAAFLAHAFLRAPGALWDPLDYNTKQRFVNAFKQLRRVKIPYNNWILFAAIIETFLQTIDEEFDPVRIDWAIRKMKEWYVGDGWYSDGSQFHFDYYNSYVIQPMLLDIMKVQVEKGAASKEDYALLLGRMQRYSEILERLISPEGSFPAFGRSITYRTGAFQPLAQLALMRQLPDGISPAQVRTALTAVKQRIFAQAGVFGADGWLQLGFAGHQPEVADGYTNTGSLYLTSLSFLPLGLSATDPFWMAAAEDWTGKRAWTGQSFKKDHAITI